jgi:Subtilase family
MTARTAVVSLWLRVSRAGRRAGALGSVAIAGALALLVLPGAALGAVSPLPRSDYTIHAACAHAARDRAGCLALQLVPQSAAARARRHPLGLVRRTPLSAPSPAAGAFGLRPQDLHSAYQLPDSPPSAQTVALVDAYNDPSAEADLKAYDEEFSLPECTAADGCFEQVNQNGEAGNLPFPKTAAELEKARKGTRVAREEAAEATGWDLEISLDIEVAHATCQSCRILLVEAGEPSYEDLETAERSAATLGAGEISNSWAGPEEGETPALESSSPFNDPGVAITAAAGDDGYLNWDASKSERGYVNFPASSPHVIAVGGTRLSLGENGVWAGESVWNGYYATGGGCSTVFAAQPWQQSLSDWSAVGCGGKRAVADVAADADPYTGLAVYDTSAKCECRYEEARVKHVLYWCTIGGTSLSSPLIAAVFALAGGAGEAAYPAQTLYENETDSPGSLHDVTAGSNGACSKPYLEGGLSACTAAEEAASCASELICLAGAGYDGPTGVGTPDGIAAFATAGPPPVEPPSAPEFGRCVKVAKGAGSYSNAACTKTGETNSHEWDQGVLDAQFATASTSEAVTLTTVKGTEVRCAAETSAGEYTGPKTVGVVLTLTGCELSGEQCSSGTVAGEIVSSPLDGVLGIYKLGTIPIKDQVGLDLFAASGPFMQFSCGAIGVSVRGSAIVPVKTNRMLSTATLAFKARRGKQRPESFVEGPPDVLEASFDGATSERIGLAFTASQTNREAVEVSSVN